MTKKTILFCLILVSSLVSIAQPPKKFYNRYGGNGYDFAYDVKQTLDKGYIITGSTNSFGKGNTDMYLLKIDSMGQKKFETSFGGYSNDIGKSILELPDSSIVILGYTSSLGLGGYDIYLVKVDKTGNLLWQKTIGGSDWDFANSIQKTVDGGFIIAGSTYSFGYGNSDGYVLKTDGNGNVIWAKTFGGDKDDEFNSVIQSSDGGFVIAGCTKSYNDSFGDAWVFKLNSVGDSLYSESLGGNYYDYFSNVIELPNLNLYYVGANKSYKNDANSVNWQYLTDNSHNVLLNNFIGNTNTERYNSSAVGLNGMIVTVGYNNFLGTNSDGNIHVFYPNLSYYSYSPFGIEKTDELFSISRTADKGFVSVGNCFGNTSYLNDILFVKIDSLGSYGSSIIGVEEISSQGKSIHIFPNPTSDFININIHNFLNESEMNYRLIDINGKIVLSDVISDSNTYIKMEDIASGLYVIQIFNASTLFNSEKISIIKP